MTSVSVQRPARIAVYSPSAVPIANHSSAAPIASANVRGMPRLISSTTFVWLA